MKWVEIVNSHLNHTQMITNHMKNVAKTVVSREIGLNAMTENISHISK